MQVKLWGVRGSLPRTESPVMVIDWLADVLKSFEQSKLSIDDFLASRSLTDLGGYGGNTSCAQIIAGDSQIIIDGGSGLKDLGQSMLAGPAGKGQAVIDFYMTHFHLDHIIGLPFFVPIFIPGNEIRFHSVHDNCEEIIRSIFKKPLFPVEFDWLGAKISFHRMKERSAHNFGDLKCTPYQLDHPDPCWGLRVEHKGRSLAYCVDSECTRSSKEELGEDRKLYQNANVMIFDAQYTVLEILEKVNWGHAVSGQGLDIAFNEKIDRVFFVHHDPYADRKKIEEALDQTKRYYDLRVKEAKKYGQELHPVQWEFAYDGIEIDI